MLTSLPPVSPPASPAQGIEHLPLSHAPGVSPTAGSSSTNLQHLHHLPPSIFLLPLQDGHTAECLSSPAPPSLSPASYTLSHVQNFESDVCSTWQNPAVWTEAALGGPWENEGCGVHPYGDHMKGHPPNMPSAAVDCGTRVSKATEPPGKRENQ